ncbi:N-acetylmuramoyl-L-alanine amidase, family 2 [Candidatus Sulfopaludibacter sp. SbA4]|nr:N-acetylmuramoyl-L-alanine amidase, family 2 [Candidatus Sulfopaludibacter sp. SbA4]
MGTHDRGLALQPLVEWRASRIDDPVLKLKYLRSAVPRLEKSGRRMRAFLRFLPLVLAFVTVSACLVRAMVQVDPLPTHIRHIKAPVLGAEGLPDVWQVEGTKDWEIYSNGLRIDNRFAVSNHPRSYQVFPVDHPEEPGEPRTQPAGIVFHTTESQQAPFEAGKNGVLKQVAESLAEFVRIHRAYNFLIDRFGRVYRIVYESDAADHAGHSVWADREWLYVNLNESFLGVSFEAKTEPGQEVPTVSPAQVRAAAMLVEMLRARYGISATNCVTHAQVSVNPSNMRVGYHTDWASSFPFEQLGLPNNYDQPIPALMIFGFESDATFLRVSGARLYAGVELAEERLKEQADERGLPLAAYRSMLQRLYREKFHRPSATSVEQAE